MPKKNAPARPPVKAKSALPAPRMAPKRVHIPWHRHTWVRIVGLLVVVALVIVGALQVHSFWKHHTTTSHSKAQVKTFDAQFQSELSPIGTFLTQAQNSPPQYAGGLMTQANYVSQTAQWYTTMETLSKQLNAAKVPPILAKAKAELIQGVQVFIDAINQFSLAGTTTDKNIAAQLVQLGTNTVTHAETVFSDGAQEEAIVVHAFGLPLPSGETPAVLQSPPAAPPETTTVSPASPSPSASP
ncbi:MAG TPA: hypothetical protein VFW71_00975 [Actinomycetota bacterium]|nr:hypothetical protein [Actinomycetota bacterium]